MASIRSQFSTAVNVAISRFGIGFIRDFQQSLGVDVGVGSLGLKENGYLFLAHSAEGATLLSDLAEMQRGLGAATEVWTPEQVKARFAWLEVGHLTAGSFSNRDEGWFDNRGPVSYTHLDVYKRQGKIGVLVALNGPAAAAETIGKQFAMHIAATSPLSLSEATLDPVLLERELAVQTAKALEENATSAKPKPDAVVHNNIIPGRMKRFLSENTLLGQAFVINPDLTVEQAAKEAGVEITGYRCV